MRSYSLGLAVSLAISSTAMAQDIDENEILSLFQSQRDAFATLRDGGTMKTRGLTLVTVEDVETSTVAPEQVDGQTLVNTELAPLTPPGEETTVQTQLAPLQPTAPGASDTSVTFGRLDPELQVNLFIKFAFDSASIDEGQKPTLDRMCTVMRDSDIEVFQIVGHTDTAGSESYNERLSRLRAEEVARYLISSCAISATRLSTLGLGERFPINAQDTRADENRRVEFQALS